MEVSGLRLHYGVWGATEASPLILLHGAAANSHWWDWVAPALSPAFRVLALDFPGHGKSGWPRPARYDMNDFLQAVIGFLNALGRSPVHLAGHSLGGKIAMLVAAKYPRRVQSLVIVDVTPSVSPYARALLRQVAARPSRRFGSAEAAARAFRLMPSETVAEPRRLRALALRSVRHCGHGRWSIGPDPEFFARFAVRKMWSSLGRIRCPTLILRAAESTVLDRQTGQEMQQRLCCGVLREIAHSHHHLIVERPTKVAKAIGDFLKETCKR